jgi:RNA polymerase sigma-54 factor
MAIGLQPYLRPETRQILTMQQRLALKLLQHSILELQQKINAELWENPNLELAENDAEAPAAEQPEPGQETDTPEIGAAPVVKVELPADRRETLDADWRDYIKDYPNDRHDTSMIEPFSNDDAYAPEERISRKATLEEYLLWQLRVSRVSEKEALIGAYIIGNLDDRGYLGTTIEDIASATESRADEIEAVLKRIQFFDPVGVGARDLRECLWVQLENHGAAGTLAARIVADHLADLESKKYQRIAAALGVTIDAVAEAAHDIASLEPKPSRAYASEEAHYAIPEIFVEKDGEGYVISLNDSGLPRLRISSMYGSLAGREDDDAAEARQYLKKKLADARSFIDAIAKRQKTMRKVAESIFKFQREFLDGGVDYVKPMVLRDVAADIEMHESTVSRATANKWASTPHGVFELKWFFQGGLSTDSGEVASQNVKSKIREIVAKENKQNPYSDEQIAALLSDGSIRIARRTVAKYREAVGILSSARRRQPR